MDKEAGKVMAGCIHLEKADTNVIPKTPEGCEECLKTGDTWVHLRLCLICGHVGCCDNSKNKHATKHFHTTQHPVIKSFEPGEDWKYCYVDDLIVE
jgi:CPA1 family monovalent cation:H+ antiporter